MGLSKQELLAKVRQYGFVDKQLRSLNPNLTLPSRTPCFRMVDTCAGEFAAYTPYYYSVVLADNHASHNAQNSSKKKVIILGSGPIRIGQGIEFDYSTVHAVQTVQDNGYEALIINNNPETVSTDFDISNKLYFEPLFSEEVLAILEEEKENLLGVIPQFGGQTAINLAETLDILGIPLLGSPASVIEQCENRKFTSSRLTELHIPVTPWTVASHIEEAIIQCREIGYPVLVRPSFVLGGRGMKIIYDETSLAEYLQEAVEITPELPVYIDKFLQEAKEIDVDAVCDGKDVFHVVMEQIEHAGVHSGDSACVIPAQSLSPKVEKILAEYTRTIALAFGIVGLMNIQFAVKDDDVFVLEINPRASRTVPFASKAIHVQLAKVGTSVMLGIPLVQAMKKYATAELSKTNINPKSSVCVKEVVLPFRKLQLDPLLTPEMQSTGEVIGVGQTFGEAFYKAQIAAGSTLALEGNMFISLSDAAKNSLPALAVKLRKLPFSYFSTEGTAKALQRLDVPVTIIKKISEGSPNILDVIQEQGISLLINIPEALSTAQQDALTMRAYVVEHQIPFISTLPALKAAFDALEYALVAKKKG